MKYIGIEASYGVFKWRGDSGYYRADCLKWYKSEKAAQKYADKLTAEATHEGYVVKHSRYVNR